MAAKAGTQAWPDVRAGLRRPAAQTAVTLGACAVVGSQVSNLPDLPPAVYLLLAVGSVALLHLCRLGPRWCLIGLVVATTLGLYRFTLGLGPVDLRVTDIFYVALVAWVLARRSRVGQLRPQIGQRHIGWFLAVLAISIVSFRQGDLLASSISMARFIQTMSLLWLVPYATRTARDRVVLVNVLLLSIAGELVFGLLTQSGDRFTGQNGPDTEGLLAALLLVGAVRGATLTRPAHRIALGAVAAIAFLQTESIGGMLAAGGVLALAGMGTGKRPQLGSRPVATVVRTFLLLGGVLLLVSALRPENVPGSPEFGASSTAHRAILGSAGLEIFEDNPIFGVGWQQSSRPEIIGTPEIRDALRDRFPRANDEFFPDVNPGTVHNAYISVLAETGLVGVATLVSAFVAVRRRLRDVAATLVGENRAVFDTVRLLLVAVLIWWNDNPLFGAQPETVLAATFLGLLASHGVRDADVAHPADVAATIDEADA